MGHRLLSRALTLQLVLAGPGRGLTWFGLDDCFRKLHSRIGKPALQIKFICTAKCGAGLFKYIYEYLNITSL